MNFPSAQSTILFGRGPSTPATEGHDNSISKINVTVQLEECPLH